MKIPFFNLWCALLFLFSLYMLKQMRPDRVPSLIARERTKSTTFSNWLKLKTRGILLGPNDELNKNKVKLHHHSEWKGWRSTSWFWISLTVKVNRLEPKAAIRTWKDRRSTEGLGVVWTRINFEISFADFVSSRLFFSSVSKGAGWIQLHVHTHKGRHLLSLNAFNPTIKKEAQLERESQASSKMKHHNPQPESRY